MHKDAAWKLALYICKDQELTKDAVQVSFTSAYTYLHAFRRDASFKTWLLRIVKNESVRLCKLENRYADIDEEQVETSQDVGDTIIDKLENVDQSRWINDVFIT